MPHLAPVHPFPARMAPEIALAACEGLPPGASVLDPMSGSGTALRVAAERGLSAIGRDTDPLAVLIASVWCSGVGSDSLMEHANALVDEVRGLGDDCITLNWIDHDPETRAFINFWFAERQQRDLRKFAHVLSTKQGVAWDAARVALSRLIVTKESRASLARDTSHSRPHRVRAENDFDVVEAFGRVAVSIARALNSGEVLRPGAVQIGDARALDIASDSVDVVITSPPYLNAIDYMRGHKLSLVWLGYTLRDLRHIRGAAIGAERGPGVVASGSALEMRAKRYPWYAKLEGRRRGMVLRYISDVDKMLSEISRVLKTTGSAVIVIGNSCLKGVYIENSQVVVDSAESAGLELTAASSRALPNSRRYLPTPRRLLNEDLAKRMRHELVLSFAHG